MNKQEFAQWICDKLTAILQFEIQNDMAEYVFCISSVYSLFEFHCYAFIL